MLRARDACIAPNEDFQVTRSFRVETRSGSDFLRVILNVPAKNLFVRDFFSFLLFFFSFFFFLTHTCYEHVAWLYIKVWTGKKTLITHESRL